MYGRSPVRNGLPETKLDAIIRSLGVGRGDEGHLDRSLAALLPQTHRLQCPAGWMGAAQADWAAPSAVGWRCRI